MHDTALNWILVCLAQFLKLEKKWQAYTKPSDMESSSFNVFGCEQWYTNSQQLEQNEEI